ncbi:hypothetical protein O4160_11295 [Rhodococcus sp. IEGM 1401]|uniref:hypothetical protein n=1 Tax=unclassified Rhodococcus (in: high G+C Gram-positive bacteria) TaxID=192944 RepID=UPI0022B35F86|nr:MULTISPECIES: hypothetical protein [unclassified Rhodococcus (in: high G+C Gram-positive bacteria)]MCZ4561417.1 hypothetical protein [Rhodococcus sp. IEGM 1401]MDI9921455.1 hypothetical protein [Rhodococcus sp. IEGM 1372]MDV8034013.1 hypothetical protein [Rhodococcus sp. IEGM 1414]
MKEIRKLTLAVVVTTVALTACGNQDAPAAGSAPSTSAAAEIPAPPQVTVAAPSSTSGEGSGESAEAPAATSVKPTAADPANNTAPITPVDPATYSVPDNQVAWKSPSGNVYCKIGSGPSSSGCQASDAPVPAGAEADCAPNTTFTIDMLSKGFYLDPGHVTPTCFNQGVFGAEGQKVLQYNTSITFSGFTCFSRVEAMICDAGGGHGFVLSMQQATSN